jgi:glycosyltransferase involved in cell wall biosynthesis
MRRKKWAKITQEHFGPTSPPTSNPIGWGSIEMLEKLPKPDVWNMHWVSWFLDWENLLPWMAEQAPIVWTLHDLNPLRGIWHYEPQTEERTPVRICYEAEAMELKRRALTKIPKDRISFVGPSRWMLEESRKSLVTSGFRAEHIPYGLDLDIFSPKSPSELKSILDIKDHKLVLGFVADRLNDPRKGIQQLFSAIPQILSQHPEVHLLIAGSNLGDLAGISHTALGPLQNDLLLSHFYSACDYFVCPSTQDNLPNTVLESLACGTPVLAFNIGGIPDMIIPRVNGFLRNKDCLDDLLNEALDFRKKNNPQFLLMREMCRARANKEYSLNRQAQNYTKLYKSCIK